MRTDGAYQTFSSFTGRFLNINRSVILKNPGHKTSFSFFEFIPPDLVCFIVLNKHK